MEMMVARFNRVERDVFMDELRKRVNKYFVDNNLSKFANTNMKLKTVFMLSLYFIPFGIMISGIVHTFWLMLFLWSVMGLGMCGIGLSIMHDANHGSYSKKKIVNKILGYSLNFVGSYHITWKIQHNVLHHSSTNIHGLDEDLDNQLMRFSPNQKRKRINKYQAYFAPLLYGLLSLYKTFSKDFEQMNRFNKKKLLAGQGLTFKNAIIEIVVNKVIYLGTTLLLPILILDFPWWQTLLGFLTMHFICGLILALVFQSAHVIEKSKFYVTDDKGSVDTTWSVHQLNTTANFAKNGTFFSWLIGGLNYQIEHHLFPNICHVHYSDISPIVKQTAKEFNVEYNEYPTFISAIKSHFITLYKFGKTA